MNFVTKEPINKGWSSDKKYCVTDENGTRYLLRVSDIAQHDTKQSEFNMMKQVASFGVPMCQPIEFGTCEDGVYSIQSWIDGEDAEQVMSGYSDTEQYVYGLEADVFFARSTPFLLLQRRRIGKSVLTAKWIIRSKSTLSAPSSMRTDRHLSTT